MPEHRRVPCCCPGGLGTFPLGQAGRSRLQPAEPGPAAGTGVLPGHGAPSLPTLCPSDFSRRLVPPAGLAPETACLTSVPEIRFIALLLLF